MKNIITIMCLSVFLAGCGEMTPQQSEALSGLSETFSRIEQQSYYNQPEVTYSPGQQGIKLESWRYSQPESVVHPRTIVLPGQAQDKSTYWQEKLAEDEWWERNFYQRHAPKK